MALSFIRQLTSGKRHRTVDAESGLSMDLTYVTARIVAMGFPSAGIEAAYRNRATDVARFLRSRHAGNYLLLNLSERHYDEAIFDHRVMNVGFPDHHPPPFDLLWTVAVSMDRWLRADPANVCVVHCQAGKGRTGTVIAAALLLRQWTALGPHAAVTGPELAEGLDPMAGALHEDKGTPARAAIAGAAALPELWEGAVPGRGTEARIPGDGSAFPVGPRWARDGLRLADASSALPTAGCSAGPCLVPGVLVLRPPQLMARLALRFFWARRGEGVTYPGQARAVVMAAVEAWTAVARAVWLRRRAAAREAAAGPAADAPSSSSGLAADVSAASETGGAAGDAMESEGAEAGGAAGDATESEGAEAGGAGPASLKHEEEDEEDAFRRWLHAARAAAAEGHSMDGCLAYPLPPSSGAEASAPSGSTVRVGPCGLSAADELARWPLLLVDEDEAAAVSAHAIASLRRCVPPDPVPMTITRVLLPVVPTLPPSLGGPSGHARLRLVIEVTPHQSCVGRALFSTAWAGEHAAPVVPTGAAAVAAAVAGARAGPGSRFGLEFPVGATGVAVRGAVTLRLFARAETGAVGPEGVEVWRTTLNTAAVGALEVSAARVVRTLRGLDMDSRGDRLRGLRGGVGAPWLPLPFRVDVCLGPATLEEAESAKRLATKRAGERVFGEAAASASASSGAGDDVDPHDLCMEGWLYKRGQIRRTWQRRWVVLRHRRLVYYRQAAGEATGSIALSQCTHLGAVRPEEVEGRPHVLAVRTPDRTWLLQASDGEEAARWLRTVGRAWESLRVPLSAQA